MKTAKLGILFLGILGATGAALSAPYYCPHTKSYYPCGGMGQGERLSAFQGYTGGYEPRIGGVGVVPVRQRRDETPMPPVEAILDPGAWRTVRTPYGLEYRRNF